ncbi:hypothetical protein Vadar_015962 [Vaccinium darrowii]|uniref:Uncharacterized protein n=1 Tax=Vaccinium darrowii TaxID=229202 RepID=A0ACB7Z3Y5_9ERIC|nr:hypothetical protein Vadar_015962 [Vaccinium darrowii]
MKRIDMVFENSKWRELHDKALVFVEPVIGSDHNHLLLNTEVPLGKVGKPFRFESFWVTDDGCKDVIVEAWNQQQEGSLMFSVCKKLKGCKERLKAWSKWTFRDLRIRIDLAKEQLIDIQHQLERGFNSDLVMEERRLQRVLVAEGCYVLAPTIKD